MIEAEVGLRISINTVSVDVREGYNQVANINVNWQVQGQGGLVGPSANQSITVPLLGEARESFIKLMESHVVGYMAKKALGG